MKFLYLLIILSSVGIIYLRRTKSVISLTITDLAISAFLIYSLLHAGIVQGFRCDPFMWFKWLALAMAYLFFRRLKNPHLVLYGIVCYGLFQSFVAIGQAMSLLHSSNRFFSITGTIGNPGPLGGFLAVAMVCSVVLFRQSVWDKKSRWIAAKALITGFLSIGLLLTDSRSAFLSAVAGLLVVAGDRIWKLCKQYKFTACIVFTVTTVMLFSFLYLYRPASADARRLIWQVSCRMIADNPLFGHGAGAFERRYMLYQAAYFEQYPQSSFVMVADNAAYPYNELIHVLIELGIIGGLLLVTVFITGFTCQCGHIEVKTQDPMKAGLASFIVFSLFSYPAGVFELLLLPVAFLGTFQNKPVYSLRIFQWMKPAATGLLIGIIGFSVTGIYVSRKIYEEIKQLTIAEAPIQLPYCERYFPVLVYNDEFNAAYLSALCRLPCRPDDYPKIRSIFPSSETYCRLGEVCECYGQYKQAEQLYRKASNMIPTRILPNYCLWRLYIKLNHNDPACAMAQKILSQPLKVENTFTLQVKGQIRRYLGSVDKISVSQCKESAQPFR